MVRHKIGLCLWLVGLISCKLAAAEAAPPPLPKGITVEKYLDWEGALAVEASEAETRLVMVPGIGGRIMRYEVMGDNVLWDNPATYGLTVDTTRRALLPGGYQMFVTSGKTELPVLDRLEFGPWQVTGTRDYAVTMVSETDAASGLKWEKDVLVDPGTGEVGITQRAINTSGKELVCGIRARTQCKGGGFVLVPINKYSRFRLGWALRHQVEGKSLYDSLNPASPNVKILGNMLVAQTKGIETKIGADSDAEWIAYVQDRVFFIQYFSYDFQAKYPDGHTVAVWWNDLVTELEVLGPEVTLAGGATNLVATKWALMELKEPVTTHKQARALAAKVPLSPFKLMIKK